MSKNLIYKTDSIAEYFSSNRICWDQFYDSEKRTISKLQLNNQSTILDIGCGCGGLGLSLKEKFGVQCYTGIDINCQAIGEAKRLNPYGYFISDDFLAVSPTLIKENSYDAVFSLSCFDWNLEFDQMLTRAWSFVKKGGWLVATFRLVNGLGCNDMKKSYQYINYKGDLSGELAPYVVFNGDQLISKLLMMDPDCLIGCGYFGPPSKTAVTPYGQICFSAIAIKKRSDDLVAKTKIFLELPEELSLRLM
jgi:ubiquinone/menaquinone biosynthesis C-methylase UbiE